MGGGDVEGGRAEGESVCPLPGTQGCHLIPCFCLLSCYCVTVLLFFVLHCVLLPTFQIIIFLKAGFFLNGPRFFEVA